MERLEKEGLCVDPVYASCHTQLTEGVVARDHATLCQLKPCTPTMNQDAMYFDATNSP
jgi:hypothetical protein